MFRKKKIDFGKATFFEITFRFEAKNDFFLTKWIFKKSKTNTTKIKKWFFLDKFFFFSKKFKTNGLLISSPKKNKIMYVFIINFKIQVQKLTSIYVLFFQTISLQRKYRGIVVQYIKCLYIFHPNLYVV